MMPVHHGSLDAAMGILGALSVAVVSATGAVVWSTAAGVELPDAAVAAVAAGLVAAARQLVTAGDAGSVERSRGEPGGIEDVVVTGGGRFHILCPVVDTDGEGYAAHLVLDRRRANLALARREFRALVTGGRPGRGPHRTSARDPRPSPTAGHAPLPQRAARTPPGRGDGDDGAPSWYQGYADEPFSTETPILDRLIEGLRRL